MQCFANDNFIEIYLKCCLEECERRDPKGLYKKARARIIKNYTGISAPYEDPVNPELTIETASCTPGNLIAQVYRTSKRDKVSRNCNLERQVKINSGSRLQNRSAIHNAVRIAPSSVRPVAGSKQHEGARHERHAE